MLRFQLLLKNMSEYDLFNIKLLNLIFYDLRIYRLGYIHYISLNILILMKAFVSIFKVISMFGLTSKLISLYVFIF